MILNVKAHRVTISSDYDCQSVTNIRRGIDLLHRSASIHKHNNPTFENESTRAIHPNMKKDMHMLN
jgi:hypothetical protein